MLNNAFQSGHKVIRFTVRTFNDYTIWDLVISRKRNCGRLTGTYAFKFLLNFLEERFSFWAVTML